MSAAEDFFAPRRVAVVGLGLMGGSLALGLRGRAACLLAADPDPVARGLALERQAVDVVAADMAEILPQADVIILAAPARAILAHIGQIRVWAFGREVTEGKIILDVGSTKAEIVAAMESLPPCCDPLGGHPMCGKETSGLANADPEIYRGATFAFTPLERTGPQARACAEALAAILGARPLWLDAHTHDRWVAATSHLPYLLAASLAGATSLEAAPLVGPGFRGASRLAAASRPVMLDILQTNRQAVLEALRRFRGCLEEAEDLLAAGDFPALADWLAAASRQHAALTHPGSPEQAAALP